MECGLTTKSNSHSAPALLLHITTTKPNAGAPLPGGFPPGGLVLAHYSLVLDAVQPGNYLVDLFYLRESPLNKLAFHPVLALNKSKFYAHHHLSRVLQRGIHDLRVS
jgi:hypothetical protein